MSSSLDVNALAELIRGKGVPASLMMTGGGVGTLFVGEPNEEGFYPVAAGACDFVSGLMDWEGFCFGRDGSEEATYLEEPMGLGALADVIVAFHDSVVEPEGE